MFVCWFLCGVLFVWEFALPQKQISKVAKGFLGDQNETR